MFIVGIFAFLGGALLLFWGRFVDRLALALVGAGIGIALSRTLSERLGINWIVAATFASVLLGIVFALTSRILWAMFAGALGASVALASAWTVYMPDVGAELQASMSVPDLSLVGWLVAMGNMVAAVWAFLWRERSGMMLWLIVLACGVPLAGALLLPRMAKIVLSSFFGAIGIIGGLLFALLPVRGGLWPSRWTQVVLLGMLLAAVMIFGIIHQYRGAVCAELVEKAAKAQQAKKEKSDAVENDSE